MYPMLLLVGFQAPVSDCSSSAACCDSPARREFLQHELCHPCAALGHLQVLKAVVEVLQSSAADVAGCQASENIKEPSINMLTWGRFVKDVINARTSAGKTPLMLACEKGCARHVFPIGMSFQSFAEKLHGTQQGSICVCLLEALACGIW